MVLECGRARIHRWSTTYYFGFHPPPKRGAFIMNGGGERGTCYLSVLHVVISSSCDSSSLKSTPLTTSHLVSFTEGTLASISRFSWNDFSNFMIFCVCLPKSVTRMWRRSFLLCVHFRRLDSCFGNTRKDRVHGQARRESTTHRSTFCMDRYVLFHPSIHPFGLCLSLIDPSFLLHHTCRSSHDRHVPPPFLLHRAMVHVVFLHERRFPLQTPRWIDHVQGRGTRPPSSHPPSNPPGSAGRVSVGDPFCLVKGGGSTDQTSWDVASVLHVLRVLRGSKAKEAVQEEWKGSGRDGRGRDMQRCRRPEKV